MRAFVLLISVALCSAGYDKLGHSGGYSVGNLGGVYQPGGVYPPGGFQYKYGTCPNIGTSEGDYGRNCVYDYKCPGVQKCCYVYYSLRRVCMVPQEYRKPGACPYFPNNGGAGSCNHDYHCGGSLKCCRGYYGNVDTCSFPVYHGQNFPVGGEVGPVGGVGPVAGGVGPVVGGVGPVGGIGPILGDGYKKKNVY
ncbi:perlwapin-like [Saccostrea echinata]|uniref:perlwapin-like n=1 Tax=Saccostrea echinata TaxID=191078 RepID=UPI002A8366B5|nr:perlwapin-like [Saccostrea echinata]